MKKYKYNIEFEGYECWHRLFKIPANYEEALEEEGYCVDDMQTLLDDQTFGSEMHIGIGPILNSACVMTIYDEEGEAIVSIEADEFEDLEKYDCRVQEITSEQLQELKSNGSSLAVIDQFGNGSTFRCEIETEHDFSKMSWDDIVKSIKLGLYKYSNVSEDGEISESSVVNAIKVFDTEYDYTDSDTSVEETNFYIVNI